MTREQFDIVLDMRESIDHCCPDEDDSCALFDAIIGINVDMQPRRHSGHPDPAFNGVWNNVDAFEITIDGKEWKGLLSPSYPPRETMPLAIQPHYSEIIKAIESAIEWYAENHR